MSVPSMTASQQHHKVFIDTAYVSHTSQRFEWIYTSPPRQCQCCGVIQWWNEAPSTLRQPPAAYLHRFNAADGRTYNILRFSVYRIRFCVILNDFAQKPKLLDLLISSLWANECHRSARMYLSILYLYAVK